ncbi:MAG TPA: B12-binding domain-containing radical SAM protein [Dehalococcoidia bacterium]
MRILLVYPQYPDTFWSFKHALKFVSKKAAFPPLGLLTVAAMLPREWDKKLIDLNVTNLSDKDIEWADYVFISAMAVQKESVEQVIKRCRRLRTKIVAGGPLFTTGHEEFDEVDHFVLNEAEITLPLFLEDLKNGQEKHIYTSDKWADITKTPIPAWDLIDARKYSSMAVQYSRGCPFDCEFCDIVVLNGHTPRTKGTGQLLKELEEFHRRGRRQSVFIVDDNFIGNKKKLKAEILPAIIDWMRDKKKPFSLFTEASINLADDEKLMQLMAKANFNMVFVGIETTHEDSLAECSKMQNRNRDMVAAVKKLQNHGLQVQGGFILGFDNDPPAIFENMINFIQKSGIVTAMVGLLNAPRGTRLYRRLKHEKRLLSDFTGDNTDCTMNFIPRMERKRLMSGYKKVIDTIYAPKQYYERITTFLKEYKPTGERLVGLQFEHVKAFFKSVWYLGIVGKGRQYYWRLLAWTLARRPRSFSISIVLAIYGFHFRKVVENYIMTLSRENGSTA